MISLAPYTLHQPNHSTIPILVSMPHSGLHIPKEVTTLMTQEQLTRKGDTDFDVHLLYEFAKSMGLTTIKANYNRWYVDLNRRRDGHALYYDGRTTTSLIPTKDFFERNIYRSPEQKFSTEQVQERLNDVYDPYYNQITQILERFVKDHGIAILWDAHSINRRVPSIHPQPFSDLILGTNDQKSASIKIIECVQRCLQQSQFSYSINVPFKGGNITRSMGRPSDNIHALQLEMSKDCYLENETSYHADKAKPMVQLLQQIFASIIDVIK